MPLEIIIESALSSQLASLETGIAGLFERAFQRPFNSDLWRWLHASRSTGSSISAVCLFDGEVIGHHMVTPMSFRRDESGAPQTLGLSVMSMIDRDKGLIQWAKIPRSLKENLADQIFGGGSGQIDVAKAPLTTYLGLGLYQAAAQSGMAGIYGFPNVFSAPGFKKHLGWTLPMTDKLVQIGGAELMQAGAWFDWLARPKWRFDAENRDQLAWRLDKPSTRYQRGEGFISKEFAGNYDLIASLSTDAERLRAELIPDAMYQTIMPADVAAGLSACKIVDDYQFGMRFLPSGPNFSAENFDRAMIMSDIF